MVQVKAGQTEGYKKKQDKQKDMNKSRTNRGIQEEAGQTEGYKNEQDKQKDTRKSRTNSRRIQERVGQTEVTKLTVHGTLAGTGYQALLTTTQPILALCWGLVKKNYRIFPNRNEAPPTFSMLHIWCYKLC